MAVALHLSTLFQDRVEGICKHSEQQVLNEDLPKSAVVSSFPFPLSPSVKLKANDLCRQSSPEGGIQYDVEPVPGDQDCRDEA